MLEEVPNEDVEYPAGEVSGFQKTPCVRWGLDSDSCVGWLVKGEEKPTVKIQISLVHVCGLHY